MLPLTLYSGSCDFHILEPGRNLSALFIAPRIAMTTKSARLLIFTDVDGCLINKHDYDFHDAVPALEEVDQRGIPLILASSKTASELTELSSQLPNVAAPLICENGSTTLWRGPHFGKARTTTIGIRRNEILPSLRQYKGDFRFRSFDDLQLEGIMHHTGLSREAAERAMERSGTEPLIWDDDKNRLTDFQKRLRENGLNMTRGGRFWHVSGHATKGAAMSEVVDIFAAGQTVDACSIAVGDSPIDQSMLDQSDFPVGILAPDGSSHVVVGPTGLFSNLPGAAGWAQAIRELLERIDGNT